MAGSLAIKNWAMYQSTTKRNAAWVKDYTLKDVDEGYSDLTMVERYILDACCRLRGRQGRDITADPLALCRALAIKAQDRHNATKAIRKLIERGWLIPTNEQVKVNKVPSEKEREVEKEIEKEEDARSLPPLALAQKVAAELCLEGSGIIHSIAGAVKFCQKHEGKSPNGAVEFLIAQARDELDHGGAPNKFWFDDRKWRKHAPIAAKTKMQESLDAINKL